MVLIDAAYVEGHRPGQRCQCREHPRVERVSVDGDRYRDGALSPGLERYLGNQGSNLMSQAKIRDAGFGDAGRFRPLQQHCSCSGFEALDALADCGRGHVQSAGRCVERSLLDDGSERLQLREVEVRHKRY